MWIPKFGNALSKPLSTLHMQVLIGIAAGVPVGHSPPTLASSSSRSAICSSA